MNFTFEFYGGSVKPDQHQLEKFLLFFVTGPGGEQPLYHLTRAGLVTRNYEQQPRLRETLRYNTYSTGLPYAKIFVSQTFPKRFYSFFVRLEEEAAPVITILPFSKEKLGFYFRARGHFLSNKEAMELLEPGSPSYKFVQRQGMLPKDVLKGMVKIDRSKLKEGVRQIRVGKKNFK